MKFPTPKTLQEIASMLKIPFVGAPTFEISGMNEIHLVTPGDIVFVDHPKYYQKALQSKATTILINKEVPCPVGKSLLISKDPFSDFNALSEYFLPFVSASVSVAPTAVIGENTHIQPQVFIGNHVKIGRNCRIHPNVVIYDHCEIGDGVIIHAGTVLGADAFYYKNRLSGHDKLCSTGKVIIESHVEIGALCTIDRGVTGATTIGYGTKLDNQVHIGHDTQIGKHCLIASQTGIAGCVVVEDRVTLWGQVGTTSGITIGEKAVVMGQTGVTKSIMGGKSYFGTPVQESREQLKQLAQLKQLPKLLQNKQNKAQ